MSGLGDGQQGSQQSHSGEIQISQGEQPMPALQILDTVLAVIEFLLIIPGLWVAGKLLPQLIDWVRPEGLRAQITRPTARLIIWLGIGTLFTYPLLDIVGLAGSWPAFITPSSGSYPSIFGAIPSNSLAELSIVILVLIYLGVGAAMRQMISRPKEIGGLEWTFIVLTAASLIYRFVSRGILGFLQLPLSSTSTSVSLNLGSWGFILAAAVGLALLAVIVIGLNMALAEHPLEDAR
jgi:hypothetical protein